MAIAATPHAERIFTASFGDGAAAEICADSSIIASWRRCLDHHKLDPERQAETRVLTRGELREAREPLDTLLSLSVPLLDDLHRQVRDLGYVVLLTDRNGITLNAHARDDGRAYQKWGLWTGSVWSEGLEGTNGVGLCLTEQRPVTVHRGDHFRSRHASLTCTVAPLFDTDGAIIGSLDISAFNQDIDTRIVGFAQRATTLTAGWIEAACFRHAYRSCWIVSLGESIEGKALLAFDEDRRLKGASRLARRKFGLDDALIRKGIEIVRDDHPPSAKSASLRHDGGAAFLALGSSLSFSPPLEKRRTSTAAPMMVSPAPSALDRLAGEDGRLRIAIQRIRATASMKSPLLIMGETGSGKEAFARAVHEEENGTGRPFIRLDCRALPMQEISLAIGAQGSPIQNILSDHFEQAKGGTLFFDEIGDLAPSLQALLVPMLDEESARDREEGQAIRLISATQQDLAAQVAALDFRADLYYRLNGLALFLPPLRRRDDKSRLIDRIWRETAPNRSLSEAARAAIEGCEWPGNFRQLRQVFQLAVAGSNAPCLDLSDFDLPSFSMRPPSASAHAQVSALEQAEREVIAKQLAEDRFDITKAAGHLGMSRATLYRKIKHFGLRSGR